jgi:hypothetical protein
MKVINMLKGIESALTENEKKELIIYLFDVLEKPASMFYIKKYIDYECQYESSVGGK